MKSAASPPPDDRTNYCELLEAGDTTTVTGVDEIGIEVQENSTELEFDARDVQLHAWSHPLKSPDDVCGGPREHRYVLYVAFQMAQIEAVVGVASYRRSLTTYLVLWTLDSLASLFVALYPLWKMLLSSGASIALLVVAIVAMVAISGMRKWRIMTTRRAVRERFVIPGKFAEDRSTVDWNQGRAIRQMARHVHCDRTNVFANPETTAASSASASLETSW